MNGPRYAPVGYKGLRLIWLFVYDTVSGKCFQLSLLTGLEFAAITMSLCLLALHYLSSLRLCGPVLRLHRRPGIHAYCRFASRRPCMRRTRSRAALVIT